MAPAMYWRRIVYQTAQWQKSDVLQLAKDSMMEIGLTNIQQQATDVFVTTPTMFVTVGVVHAASNIWVVIPMVAATSNTEASNTINSLDDQIKKHQPF